MRQEEERTNSHARTTRPGPAGTPGGSGTDPSNPFDPTGSGSLWSGALDGMLFNATLYTFYAANNWAGDPFPFSNYGLSDLLDFAAEGEIDVTITPLGVMGFSGFGPAPGKFFGGPMDVGGLIGSALVALLNPDCANLFGGFKNAVASLFNSSYNRYVPGQDNPFPKQIDAASWRAGVQEAMNPDVGGFTYAYGGEPGGVIFFTGKFSTLAPGFASIPTQASQMTAFFHEQEHAALHDPALDREIDHNYPADFEKINKNCKLPPIETQNSPITGDLTPP